MTSTIKRVEGGGFTKNPRFKTHVLETPGPAYNLPSMTSHHIQAPVYGATGSAPPKSSELAQPAVGHPMMPNASRDRTAWMIGATKDDLAYFADVADKGGPGAYSPDHNSTKNTGPRPKFGKDARFQAMTRQYVSKAHNQANLCAEGPGPKYLSAVTQLDLVTPLNAKWGMGKPTEFNTTRDSFLQGQIKDGYMYRAIPATGEKKAEVSAASYSPELINVCKTRSVQHKFDKNDRFKFVQKQYQGKKMAATGLSSPGPAYAPENGTLAKWAKKGNTATPQGKWCP